MAHLMKTITGLQWKGHMMSWEERSIRDSTNPVSNVEGKHDIPVDKPEDNEVLLPHPDLLCYYREKDTPALARPAASQYPV